MPPKRLPAVTIYTDGGCDPNPGPGGWAAVCKQGKRSWEVSGAQSEATNNQMELMAVLRAIESLEESSAITLFTDSQLVIGWLSEGWKRRDSECRTLCERIERAITSGGHTLKLRKVAGHTGNALNERAHRLVQSAIRNLQSQN